MEEENDLDYHAFTKIEISQICTISLKLLKLHYSLFLRTLKTILLYLSIANTKGLFFKTFSSTSKILDNVAVVDSKASAPLTTAHNLTVEFCLYSLI